VLLTYWRNAKMAYNKRKKVTERLNFNMPHRLGFGTIFVSLLTR
jgi:hypothetical protein